MSKLFSKIYVEITNVCNLNCSFCSKSNRNKKEMSAEEFRIVASKIKDYTNNIYLHVKGEPLLHSNLDEILSICDENKLIVSITTNGTFLEKQKEILLRHPIKSINVSLHSENNYPNYFEKVFHVCDELAQNITIIYRIWLLKNMQLDEKSTLIVEKIQNHYHLNPLDVDKIKKEKNIKIGKHLYIDKDIEFIWPKEENSNNDTGTCLGTRTHIGILSNGTVVPCCLDSEGIINLGNIFSEELSDILGSNLFSNIRSGFQNNRITCNLCKNCSFRRRFELK